MIKKFNHVGIAVRDLDKAIDFFGRTFGTRIIWRATYPDQEFETVLVGRGDVRFELLHGLSPESFVSRFIEERGEGIHHMSLEVDQFGKVIEDMRSEGLKVIGEADAEDFRAAFIHPQGSHGVLTEIIEPKGGWGDTEATPPSPGTRKQSTEGE